jgi:hypothetical protein
MGKASRGFHTPVDVQVLLQLFSGLHLKTDVHCSWCMYSTQPNSSHIPRSSRAVRGLHTVVTLGLDRQVSALADSIAFGTM